MTRTGRWESGDTAVFPTVGMVRRIFIAVISKMTGDEQTAYFLWSWLKSGLLGRPSDCYESCMPEDKRKALRRCTEAISRIQGGIVECGVFRGGGILQIAATLKELGIVKTIYGFDSFEGMPEHAPADRLSDGSIFYGKGVFSETSLRLVDTKARLMKLSGHIRLCEGFFENTIPKVFDADKQRFSFVIIDCDQYRGTKFCLEFFYDRITPGGILIIDDYHVPENVEAPGVKIAVDDFMKDKAEKLQPLALSLYGFRKL